MERREIMSKISKIFCVICAFALIITATALPSSAQTVSQDNIKLDKPVIYKSNTGLDTIVTDEAQNGTILPVTASLETSYTSPYISDVRDQKNSGTCWAFSALASLESTLLKDGISKQFSPMHMSYYADPRSGSSGFQNEYFHGGGNHVPALAYLTTYSGAVLESDMPFNNTSTPDTEAYKKATPLYGADKVVYIDAQPNNSKSIENVKNAIKEYGSVTAAFGVYWKYFDINRKEYYCPDFNVLTASGHGIQIVGWDDNHSKSNFVASTKPQNDGAWLCKNSWGTETGYNGLFYISYEDKSLFTKEYGNTYSIDTYHTINDSEKLYSHDGASIEDFTTGSSNTADYISVFDFKDNFTTIEKINFESTAQGQSYKIYYIPINPSPNEPYKSKAKWTLIASGTLEYSGHHSIDVNFNSKDYFTTKNGRGCIGIELAGNHGVGYSYDIDYSDGSPFYKSSAKKGECYVLSRSVLTDLCNWYSNVDAASFDIKALTKQTFLCGDSNFNSEITIEDATFIQQILAKIANNPTDNQTLCADANQDEKVNILDVTHLQRYLAKLSCSENIGTLLK